MQRNQFSLISVVFFILFVGCKAKTVVNNTSVDEITKMEKDIQYLASDELEGREIGTPGEKKAADYIAGRMEEIGLKPIGNEGYFQFFDVQIKSNPHADAPSPDDPTITGMNVIGLLDKGADKTVFIGAHYDHLGYGHEGSLYIGEPQIHNGADDNASGVTAMLTLAERLSKLELSTNYAFIGFSGEEKGLWGSKYYVDHPTVNIEDINAMLNMDMVGRLSSDYKLAVYGNGTSPLWNKVIGEADNGFTYTFSPSGIGPSDHTSFYLKNIPVLHFFSGQHSDYHKPTDDVEFINYQGIQKIVNLMEGIILQIDDRKEIPFSKTKDEQQEKMDFKVTLGVMPDYMYNGKGMRIDAVRDQRPAQRADMMAGDVVIKMGDLEILDIMSYMKALGSFEPGSTVPVVIKRDEQEIEKQVTFDK